LIAAFDKLLSSHQLLTHAAHPLPAPFADLRALLDQFSAAAERWRLDQQNKAEAFNLFEVLNLTGDELRHSMLLAWLLDHRLTAFGTHAQGNLGFRLFLEELDLPVEYAQQPYFVFREVSGDRSRIDIRVQARGAFILDIENKIWSAEGEDQTNSEWKDLQKAAKELSAPNVHAFFLTPYGTKAKNPHFTPIKWKQMADVLEKFAGEAKPPHVKLFAQHSADALRRFTPIIPLTPEDEHEEHL